MRDAYGFRMFSVRAFLQIFIFLSKTNNILLLNSSKRINGLNTYTMKPIGMAFALFYYNFVVKSITNRSNCKKVAEQEHFQEVIF